MASNNYLVSTGATFPTTVIQHSSSFFKVQQQQHPSRSSWLWHATATALHSHNNVQQNKIVGRRYCNRMINNNNKNNNIGMNLFRNRTTSRRHTTRHNSSSTTMRMFPTHDGDDGCCRNNNRLTATATRLLHNNNNYNHNNSNSNNNDASTTTSSYNTAHHTVHITSKQSKKVKYIKELLTKRKKRSLHNQIVIEGRKFILDVYQNSVTQQYIREIYVSTDYTINNNIKESDDDHNNNDDDSFLNNNNIQIYSITPDVLKYCSDTVTNQGILAICDIPESLSYYKNQNHIASTTNTNTIITTSPNTNNNNNIYLVLDGVSDPGNVGTLIRSAVATNIAGIILLGSGCCDIWNPKTIRAASGITMFHIQALYYVDDWDTCSTKLLQQICNVPSTCIYAATMYNGQNDDDDDTADTTTIVRNNRNGGSFAYYDIDWCNCVNKNGDSMMIRNDDTKSSSSTAAASRTNTSNNKAIIIGNEGNGLSTNVRNAVVKQQIAAVHVPMMNNDNNSVVVESLNAAVCGSIIMFEAFRQQTNNNKFVAKI